MDKHTSAARTAFRRRAAWMAVLCALASASAITARWWPEAPLPTLQWLMGLSIHWQWLYLCLGGVASVVWAALGGRAAWLALLVLVTAWWTHAPSAPAAEVARGAPVLRIGTANLQIGNPDLSRLQQWLLDPASPDVVVLQEFGDDAARLVAHGPIRARYPHQVLAPAPDPFGIALLSRHPFTSTDTVAAPADPRRTPHLRATLSWQGRAVAVSAVHPMPPLDRAYALVRDTTLRDEARWLAGAAPLGVLAGDLNDTPWSTGLRGVAPALQRASGLAPTWPNLGGWLSLLPLDHVLVSAGWVRVASAVGPDLGSDHRPVVVDVAPAP